MDYVENYGGKIRAGRTLASVFHPYNTLFSIWMQNDTRIPNPEIRIRNNKRDIQLDLNHACKRSQRGRIMSPYNIKTFNRTGQIKSVCRIKKKDRPRREKRGNPPPGGRDNLRNRLFPSAELFETYFIKFRFAFSTLSRAHSLACARTHVRTRVSLYCFVDVEAVWLAGSGDHLSSYIGFSIAAF